MIRSRFLSEELLIRRVSPRESFEWVLSPFSHECHLDLARDCSLNAPLEVPRWRSQGEYNSFLETFQRTTQYFDDRYPVPIHMLVRPTLKPSPRLREPCGPSEGCLHLVAPLLSPATSRKPSLPRSISPIRSSWV